MFSNQFLNVNLGELHHPGLIACDEKALVVISTDLQPELLQHKQSVLDDTWTAAAAADVAAQQALLSITADAAAKLRQQNRHGGVNSNGCGPVEQV